MPRNFDKTTQPLLNRGRSIILRRGHLVGMSQGVVFSGVIIVPLWLFLPLLSSPLLVVSFAVACMATGAIRQHLFLQSRWPGIWDRTSSLPQTITTAHDLLTSKRLSTSTSTWTAPFLKTLDVPMPGTAIGNEIPLSLRHSFLALLSTLFICGIARGLVPEVEKESHITGDNLITLANLLEQSVLASPLSGEIASLRNGDGTEVEQSLRKLSEDLEAHRARLHDQARVLEDVQTILQAMEGTHSLAERMGGKLPERPDNSSIRSLTRAEIAALKRAAAMLSKVGLEETARWLTDELKTNTPLPDESAKLGQQYRAASTVLELLESSEGLAATFRDPDLASGGKDAGSQSDPPSDGDSITDLGQDIEVPGIRIEGGIPLGDGRLLDLGLLHETDTESQIKWLDLLGRLDVEAHWLEVVDHYSRQIQEETDESKH